MASPRIPPPITTQFAISAIIICIGLFCAAEINAAGEYSGEEQTVFDFFTLSLTWPGTYCNGTRHCCKNNGCCRSGSNAPTQFTIHGLWPDNNDGTPLSCCSGKRFDAKEISSLSDVLNEYWPPYTCKMQANCHGGKGSFWEHEWETHGTCASSVTGDEYNYFETAINIFRKYNVTEILREAGYVASNSEKYPFGGIVSAIQIALNATPEIRCSDDGVQELRLCFDKEFKPQDCLVTDKSGNGVVDAKSYACPATVSLPQHVSLNARNNKIGASRFSSFSSI